MFNNKFNSSKKDPLVEAVEGAMRDSDLHRQAVAYVNEQFGVFSRNAVVNEQKAAYDAAIVEAYKGLKEGKPLTPAQDRELDVHDDDKIDGKDFKILRARKKQKQMEEKKNCYEESDGLPPSDAAKQAGAKQEKETPASTPKRTGNAAGSTISNARDAADLKEAIARKRDIAKGGVTAPKDYSEPRHPNPGAITSPSPMVQPIKEAWKKLKEAKKEMEEARKCMGEEFDSFDFTNLDEAYANYIAETINTYGAVNEHPEATVENLHMFSEAYIAAVLGEAAACEYEKMEKHEKKSKEHKKKMKELDEARMRAEKESDKKELDEAKKWIQSAVKRPGALSKKLGVPEEKNIPASKLAIKKGDTAQTKKQKVLAKTLKHLARKKKMEEELQLDELSAFGAEFAKQRAAGAKTFSFGGKSYTTKLASPTASKGPQDNPGLKGATGFPRTMKTDVGNIKVSPSTPGSGYSQSAERMKQMKPTPSSTTPGSMKISSQPAPVAGPSGQEKMDTMSKLPSMPTTSSSSKISAQPAPTTGPTGAEKMDTMSKLPQSAAPTSLPSMASTPSAVSGSLSKSTPSAGATGASINGGIGGQGGEAGSGPNAGSGGAGGAGVDGGRGGKGGKGGSSINESVQVGDNKYRIF